MRAELDRRVFHLKTLYDVSKDIHGSVEVDAILRSFLLMSMGNFGVVTGFIMLMNVESVEIERFVTLGIQDSRLLFIQDRVAKAPEANGPVRIHDHC